MTDAEIAANRCRTHISLTGQRGRGLYERSRKAARTKPGLALAAQSKDAFP